MPAFFFGVCLFATINFLILSFGVWLYKGQKTERKNAFKAYLFYSIELSLKCNTIKK